MIAGHIHIGTECVNSYIYEFVFNRLNFSFDNRHTERSDRFRIRPSKTTQYLQSFIPTGHSDTQSTSRQINATRKGRKGVQGRRSGGKMEECLGVNIRPVVLYEWIVIWKSENMSRWCIFLCVRIIRFMADHLISAMDEYSCLAFCLFPQSPKRSSILPTLIIPSMEQQFSSDGANALGKAHMRTPRLS